MSDGRAPAGALRRRLTPIVYSSDSVEADGRRVVLRVSALGEDEALARLYEAEAHHFEGRVWVSFPGGRDQIAERLEGIAGDDRMFLFDRSAPHIYGYG